jgi:methionine synthase I (cobalamin-dependent)
MRTLREALDHRVLLSDGSAQRQLRTHDLDLARDLYGAAECVDVLNLTRAPLVRDAHIAYLEAGADVIRTNTLEASPLSLHAHGLGEDAFCINYSAAQIACEAVDSVPGRGRRRFVLGMVRDQGWDVSPAEVEDAVSVQVEGLIAGGADGIALDIVPGTGRSRMFLRGAQRAKDRLRSGVPVFLQRVAGTTEFSDRMRALADGIIRFRHGQAGRPGWLDAEVLAQGVNLVGGGDTPVDTATLNRLLRARAEDGLRPLAPWQAATAHADQVQPASSTLYPAPERAVARAR